MKAVGKLVLQLLDFLPAFIYFLFYVYKYHSFNMVQSAFGKQISTPPLWKEQLNHLVSLGNNHSRTLSALFIPHILLLKKAVSFSSFCVFLPFEFIVKVCKGSTQYQYKLFSYFIIMLLMEVNNFIWFNHLYYNQSIQFYTLDNTHNLYANRFCLRSYPRVSYCHSFV